MNKEEMKVDTKKGMLHNTLYLTSKVLIKSFKNNYRMTDDEYIERMRCLFDEYELLREKASEEE